VPQANERIVLKPRYSAFDHTPLAVLLQGLECERVVLVGVTTEGCVAQSAIDARELGYKVSIVPAACGTTDERLERVALEYLDAVVGVYLLDEEAFRG
jgi:nicotinamidase-related amidase